MKASQTKKAPIRPEAVFELIDEVFGDDLHAKRVLSLTNATTGAIASGSLAIHLIGQGLAQANEQQDPKHCIKQVDRLLSNQGLVVWELLEDWIPFILGERKDILVVLDWTNFDKDGHQTLLLSLVTGHGRGTPLIWKSVESATLKNSRSQHEHSVLQKLREIVPEDVKVTVMGDRGFGSIGLYAFIRELGFHYLIRFRQDIELETNQGQSLPAIVFVPSNGRSKTLFHARVTLEKYSVPQVVLVQRKLMKEAWCLATSREDLDSTQIIEYYGKRWGVETVFRDIKDYRFGMGMSRVRTRSTDRRDRLFLVSALSIALLTMLGAAGEAVGLERKIKANTSKTRSYSLWRQGCIYYMLLPGMKLKDATALIEKFHELMAQHKVFRSTFGIL